MQKKLSEYFRILIEQSNDLLRDYYEPKALLRSEEAVLIIGLLTSMNVVDCNLCLKEEDLDTQQGVIDFSLYLRNRIDGVADSAPAQSASDLTAILDQKNYVEELNRNLKYEIISNYVFKQK